MTEKTDTPTSASEPVAPDPHAPDWFLQRLVSIVNGTEVAKNPHQG